MSLETLTKATVNSSNIYLADFSISVPQNHRGIWRSLKIEVYLNNLQLCVVMVIGFVSNVRENITDMQHEVLQKKKYINLCRSVQIKQKKFIS